MKGAYIPTLGFSISISLSLSLHTNASLLFRGVFSCLVLFLFEKPGHELQAIK